MINTFNGIWRRCGSVFAAPDPATALCTALSSSRAKHATAHANCAPSSPDVNAPYASSAIANRARRASSPPASLQRCSLRKRRSCQWRASATPQRCCRHKPSRMRIDAPTCHVTWNAWPKCLHNRQQRGCGVSVCCQTWPAVWCVCPAFHATGGNLWHAPHGIQRAAVAGAASFVSCKYYIHMSTVPFGTQPQRVASGSRAHSAATNTIPKTTNNKHKQPTPSSSQPYTSRRRAHRHTSHTRE